MLRCYTLQLVNAAMTLSVKFSYQPWRRHPQLRAAFNPVWVRPLELQPLQRRNTLKGIRQNDQISSSLLLLLLLSLTSHTTAMQEYIPELQQSRPASAASAPKFMHDGMVKCRYFCNVCASMGFCFEANRSAITPWCR